MPILDASALENDPEGIALLRKVLADGEPPLELEPANTGRGNLRLQIQPATTASPKALARLERRFGRKNPPG